MADINLESKTPVTIGANDAAVVRRGTGGVNTGPFTAELVQLGDAAAKSTGTTAGTVAAGDHTHTASAITDFAAAVAATPAVTANTAKVSNATHTGDVTGSTALTIANDVVTNAKLANMAANTIKANATASTADPADLAVGTNTVIGRVAGNIVAAQLATGQVADNAITNAKAADMTTATIKGRATAGTGDPEDLTGTQATALLDTFTSGAKGLAPASGGGTTNFLRADGTWAAPPGGGGGSLTVQDEGSTLSTAVTTVNFTGAGVTATGTTSVTVNIPGGAGSGISLGLNYGFDRNHFF